MSASKSLYLDRRAHVRVSHHFSARFIPEPDRPLRIGRAITQDLSLRGVKLLASVIPQNEKPFSIWIPVDRDEIVCATAMTAWSNIEDRLGDSVFWIEVGLKLAYQNQSDRDAVAQAIAKKANLAKSHREFEDIKTGFVF